VENPKAGPRELKGGGEEHHVNIGHQTEKGRSTFSSRVLVERGGKKEKQGGGVTKPQKNWEIEKKKLQCGGTPGTNSEKTAIFWAGGQASFFQTMEWTLKRLGRVNLFTSTRRDGHERIEARP